MTIREFEPGDAKALCALIAGLAEHHGDTATLTPEALCALCGGDGPAFQTLVAEESGALLGYAALMWVGQLQFGVRGMDLHHLFVVPDARGKGLGAALVEAAEVRARALGARYLVVGTDAGNEAAQAFYEARGFQRRERSGPRFAKRL